MCAVIKVLFYCVNASSFCMNFTFDQLMILYLTFLAMCILWKFWYILWCIFSKKSVLLVVHFAMVYLTMYILWRVCMTRCTFCDGLSYDVYSVKSLHDSLYILRWFILRCIFSEESVWLVVHFAMVYLTMYILWRVCITRCTFCDGLSYDVYSLKSLHDSLYILRWFILRCIFSEESVWLVVHFAMVYLTMYILWRVCMTRCTFCDGLSYDVYSL